MKTSVKITMAFGVLVTLSLALKPPSMPITGSIEPYLNGMFPKANPGIGGSWKLEDAFPGSTIGSPLRIIEWPGTSDLLVLSKLGEVWKISLAQQEQTLLLDIKDRCFKLGEAGAVGIALHPSFGAAGAPDQQTLFLFYRTSPTPDEFDEKGFNRLSKFSWDAAAEVFDAESEEILIQQYDRSTWHNGGGMFFGEDGFLYLSLGDEGHEEMQQTSTQIIDRGLFSGLIRIDIDQDLTRSHPIRRQPQAIFNPPNGWGATFSQGYTIPDDNPWLSPDSSTLEEFYAIGIRSPYSLHYDRLTQKIWLSDVGAAEREEISHISKRDNLQWPYLEGSYVSALHEKPDNFIGQEKGVYYEYGRGFGSCIIGGGVYRGAQFPFLYGKFLFADYTSPGLFAINDDNSGTNLEVTTLISGLEMPDITLPEMPGISGIHFTKEGEVLLTVMDADPYVSGKILRLVQEDIIPDPPALLSELGVFTDLQNLEPIAGVIPYTVNAPLWSDGALKRRWMAVPNDGSFDSRAEQIFFRERGKWTFPEGTVFIKHFELPIHADSPTETIFLETRFFILGAAGEAYGLTYKWNEEQTDAELLRGGAVQSFEVFDENDNPTMQRWEYPSRTQCMSCHNANADHVLGVNTHQLNGPQFYTDISQTRNQLGYLSDLDIFHKDIPEPGALPKAVALSDGSVDLGLRIRSYLDANCASCHQIGGIPMVNLDLRFGVPLSLHNSVNQPTRSLASQQELVIEAGAHQSSELWIRDASSGGNKMPPIGRNKVDQMYIDSLAKWIDGLSPETYRIKDLLIYPNPSSDRVVIWLDDQWELPINLYIFSSEGRLMYSHTLGANNVNLNLSNWPAGTYLIKANSGASQQQGKFVLQ